MNQSEAAIKAPAAEPVSPWQRFYGAALRRRRQRAKLIAQRLPRPVISVGNLHWGGGGKTPVTSAIATHLRDLGLRVAILSRGHGRQSKGPLVVSKGAGSLVPVAQSGDEPALLARLKGVAVVVGEDRYLAGQLALTTSPCDVFLLDDGFSHVGLARDIELLLFPSANPWGGARLLPSGRLREPLSAMDTADALLLTGLNAPQPMLSEFQTHLQSRGWLAPSFASTIHSALHPQRPIRQALLVSAVARPESVLATAQQHAADLGFSLLEPLAFRDHHRYRQKSLQKIKSRAREADTVLTTGKDLVKLEGRLDLPGKQLVEIEHLAQPQPEFFTWLDRRLEQIGQS